MRLMIGVALLLFCAGSPAEAALVDVLRDGYIEDFTRDQNIDPDGIPDRISDTNALLAGRGEFFDQFNAFNVDSRAIMTFDISSYSGQTLSSAFLIGYGTRVDTQGSADPINGDFYLYSGDGAVGLSDFNTSAAFLGSKSFAPSSSFQLNEFQLDVTSQLQALLNNQDSYAEFRVSSAYSTVFINAGETDPNSGFSVDPRWPGPKLALEFNPAAPVPEPASVVLLGGGLLGVFWRRRFKK